MSVRFVVEYDGVERDGGVEKEYLVIDLARSKIETDHKAKEVAEGYAAVLNKLPVDASEVAHEFKNAKGICDICGQLRTFMIHDKKYWSTEA